MPDSANAGKSPSARELLRRYLPSPESARANRALRWLGPLLDRPWLWHLNRRSVALGVAVGLFFGLLIPVAQILFAGAAAVMVRANLPVAVLSTLITNPFTFAPTYLLAYQLGAMVIGEPASASQIEVLAGSAVPILPFLERWLEWFGGIGRPLIAGLAIFAVVGALVGYLGVHLTWRIAVLLRMRKRPRASGVSRGSS